MIEREGLALLFHVAAAHMLSDRSVIDLGWNAVLLRTLDKTRRKGKTGGSRLVFAPSMLTLQCSSLK